VAGNFNLPQNLDLSPLAAQTSPVEFRFYFSDFLTATPTSSGTGGIHRIDNVVLNGQVVVPEPLSLTLWLLLGITSVGCMALCRGRRV
jgi:hypothetical protein